MPFGGLHFRCCFCSAFFHWCLFFLHIEQNWGVPDFRFHAFTDRLSMLSSRVFYRGDRISDDFLQNMVKAIFMLFCLSNAYHSYFVSLSLQIWMRYKYRLRIRRVYLVNVSQYRTFRLLFWKWNDNYYSLPQINLI